MQKNLKNEFFVYLANNLFLDQNVRFDVYSKDYSYTIGGKHYLRKGANANILYLDSDGVLNAEGYDGISSNFYRILSEMNPRVNRSFDEIKGLLGKIMHVSRLQASRIPKDFQKAFTGPEIDELVPASMLHEFDVAVKKLCEVLKDCRITEEEWKLAGFYAAESTPLVTNVYPALAELEGELGYSVQIVSAGPDAAIMEQGRRLHVDGVKASKFIFHNGRLTDVEAYAGIRKRVEDKDHEACVFVTDDWSADFRIASAFGLGFVTLVTDDVGQYPCRIYAKVPEIRKDFHKLPEFVRRYQWARIYAELSSPTAVKHARNLIKCMNHFAKQGATDEFKQALNEYLSTSSLILPESAYEIKDLLEELKAASKERHKKIIFDIIGRVKETPLAKVKENFDLGLEKYVQWEYAQKSRGNKGGDSKNFV